MQFVQKYISVIIRSNYLPVVGIVAIIGTAVMIDVFASGSYAVINPSNWTLSGGATSTSFNGASGGKIIKFNAPSAPAPSPSPAPAPTPAPSPSPNPTGCPAYPAFPSSNCVGWQHTGVTLKPYTGPYTITVANTVIDSADISDCITISANNVTIKRSRLRCAGGPESSTTYGIYVKAGVSGLVIEDTEVMSTTIPSNCTLGDPPLLTRPMYLSESAGARLTRVYFHNVRTGIGVGDNTTVEDSMLMTDCNPDPHNGSGADWQHSTAINTLGGSNNVIIRHNVLDNGAENASSAMSLYPQYGPNDSFTITQNLFNSQAYYCAYLGYSPSSGESPNTRFSITNNVWGTKYNQTCGMSAPVVYSNLNITKFNTPYPSGWGNTWSGNTWENGQPYNLTDL